MEPVLALADVIPNVRQSLSDTTPARMPSPFLRCGKKCHGDFCLKKHLPFKIWANPAKRCIGK